MGTGGKSPLGSMSGAKNSGELLSPGLSPSVTHLECGNWREMVHHHRGWNHRVRGGDLLQNKCPLMRDRAAGEGAKKGRSVRICHNLELTGITKSFQGAEGSEKWGG